MTDLEREFLRLWINQPVDLAKFMVEFGSMDQMEFYDKVDDLVNNALPSARYCRNCIDGNVVFNATPNDEDSGYVCDYCGSMDIEG